MSTKAHIMNARLSYNYYSAQCIITATGEYSGLAVSLLLDCLVNLTGSFSVNFFLTSRESSHAVTLSDS